jgi:hypothetical protein
LSPFRAHSPISNNRSVVSFIADATTTILFFGENCWTILAAFLIFAALASDEPPNFITSFSFGP